MFLAHKSKIINHFRQAAVSRIYTKDSAFFFSADPAAYISIPESIHQDVINYVDAIYYEGFKRLSGLFEQKHNGKIAYLAVSFAKADMDLYNTIGADYMTLDQLGENWKIIGTAQVVAGVADFDFELKTSTLFSIFMV